MFPLRLIVAHCRSLLLGFIVILAACATASTTPTDPLQSALPTPVLTPVPAGSVVAITFTPGPAPAPTSSRPTPLSTAATPLPPTAARNPIVRETTPVVVTLTETATPGPTPTLGTPGTPDTRLTTTSVVATITALAATPTYPPTDRPHPTRRPPVVIGAAGDKVPPTSAPSKTGITVQSVSERVFAGGTASLSIKTQAQAVCELSVIDSSSDNAVVQPIPSGATHTAGKDGVIAWIWTVDANAKPGPLKLSINCGTAGVNQVQMLVGS